MNLADFLTDQLKKRGWSYRDAAEKIDISASVISNIINDTRKPDLTSLVKISEGFSVPLWRIVEMAGFDLGFDNATRSVGERIASLMMAVPDLREGLERLLQSDPEDVLAILAYLEKNEKIQSRLDQVRGYQEQ